MKFINKLIKPSIKVAYLHIPKTGGTYLIQDNNKQEVISPIKYLGHTYFVKDDESNNPLYDHHDLRRTRNIRTPFPISGQYFIMTTVRNIFDWLVSYTGHAGGWNPKYRDENHYDYHNAKNGFEYLVKTIANREDIWPNRKFIFCQVFSDQGDMVADWINHTQCLDEDLLRLTEKIKLHYNPQRKKRVGKREDYRFYYTDPLIDLVYKTWEREITLYGFSFDDLNKNSDGLHGLISPHIKNQIKYSYSLNELKIFSEPVNYADDIRDLIKRNVSLQ